MSILQTKPFNSFLYNWRQLVFDEATFRHHLVARIENEVTVMGRLTKVDVVIPEKCGALKPDETMSVSNDFRKC